MKVLVTGATGFIGNHVARALVNAGIEVRALVRKESSTLNITNIAMEIVYGDVRDIVSVREALRGCRGVFHTAAVYAFWTPRLKEIYDVNVGGTHHVMQAAQEAGVDRVVFTSTWATLGTPERGLITEESRPGTGELKGHYRLSKYMAEKEVFDLAKRGFPVVVVNPTVPIGAGDFRPTPTGRVVLDFLRGRLPAYINAVLNVVDVEDVAQGHILAWQKGRLGERYILGNKNTFLKEVLSILGQITGRKPPRIVLPWWSVLPLAYVDSFVEGTMLRRAPVIPLEGVQHASKVRMADCSKAVDELGMSQSPIEDALEKAVRWYGEHGYVKV